MDSSADEVIKGLLRSYYWGYKQVKVLVFPFLAKVKAKVKKVNKGSFRAAGHNKVLPLARYRALGN